jgi:hypothetical protein
VPKNQPLPPIPDLARQLADAEAILASTTTDAQRARLAFFERSDSESKAAYQSAEALRRDAELERDAVKHRLGKAQETAAAEERAADEARLEELEDLCDPDAIRRATHSLAVKEAAVLVELAKVRLERREARNHLRTLEVEKEALAAKLGRRVVPQSTWMQTPDGRLVTLPTVADTATAIRPVTDALKARIDACATEDPLRLFLFSVAPASRSLYWPSKAYFSEESA